MSARRLIASVAMLAASLAPGCRQDESAPVARVTRYGLLRDLVLYERPADRGGPFFLDRFESTHADWHAYLVATGSPPSSQLAALWGGAEPRGARGAQPVVRITLLEARAYARWRSCRLPRLDEALHAAAATGRSRYPWGGSAEPWRCNSGELDLGHASPVGALEAGRGEAGVYDLLGNVAEWSSTPTPESLSDAIDRAPLHSPALEPWSVVPITPLLALVVAAERDARFLVLGGHFLSHGILDADSRRAEPPFAVGRPATEWGDSTGVRLASDAETLLQAFLHEPDELGAAESRELVSFLRAEGHRRVLAAALPDLLRAPHPAGPLLPLLQRELVP
jgi:hypothetical protein